MMTTMREYRCELVEYVVTPEGDAAFLEAIHEYARVRRRDGAYSWGIFHDTEIADHYLETFLVNSWAEHLRQHERQTPSDRDLEQRCAVTWLATRRSVI